MPQPLTLSRAAKLAGVRRSQPQEKLRASGLDMFEGKIAIGDLLSLYPQIDLDRDPVFERIERIKETARPKREHSDGWIPQPEVLLARLREMQSVLVRTKAALNRGEALFQEISRRLKEIGDGADSQTRSKLDSLLESLSNRRESPSFAADARAEIFGRDTFLKVLAARVKLAPSGHEYFVEGKESLLDAALRAEEDDGAQVPVDTGFIVYNEPNYPHLTGLFDVLGVKTRDTDMSFAASVGDPPLEYAGSDLNTLFAQRLNLLSRSFLAMVWDILRFNRSCKEKLRNDSFGDLTIGEMLEQERLGARFRDHYLLPMAAAIWSCPPQTMLEFPAASFARFLQNHGLLDLRDRPQWKTVQGGSHTYIHRMLADLGPRVRSGDPVTSVAREGGEGFAQARLRRTPPIRSGRARVPRGRGPCVACRAPADGAGDPVSIPVPTQPSVVTYRRAADAPQPARLVLLELSRLPGQRPG